MVDFFRAAEIGVQRPPVAHSALSGTPGASTDPGTTTGL